jgi:mono/diheme cytochrome c family protein
MNQFTLGRELYVGKCAKCHVAEPVQNYTELEWVEDIMPPMVKKTKLNAYEAEAVLAYVLAARKIPLPNPSNR